MLYVTLTFVATAMTAALAGYAWRYRSEPGARQFAGLMVTVALWSAFATGTLLTGDPLHHKVLERLQYLGIAFLPVPWLLFAFAYTGYDEFATRRAALALSVLPAVTLVLVWTNHLHGLVWTDSWVVVADGPVVENVPVERHLAGPWFIVNLVYAYLLVVAGAALLLRLVAVSDYLYFDQSALLVVGTVVPLVANVVSVTGLAPIEGLDVTPMAFAVTGVTFGYALFGRRLFDLVPATRRLGRDAAIADLDDGVLILDGDHRVVYCNAAAGEIVGRDPAETIGEVSSSLFEDVDFDAPGGLGEIAVEDRTYEVTSSEITDREGTEIGLTLVLHDVTARKRRERRLRNQRDLLRRLDEVNERVRAVTTALVGTTRREELERTVCEQLTEGDLYDAAWIASESDAVHYATDGGAADALPPTWQGDEIEGPPDVQSVVGPDAPSGAAWTVIPLSYGRTVYGTLVLAADREDAFDDRELAVLDELGRVVGQAITAVENRQVQLADAVTELEFTARDAPLSRLAEDACPLELAGVVPAEEGPLVYVTPDGDPGAVVSAVEGVEGVREGRVVGDPDYGNGSWRGTDGQGDGSVVECIVVEGSPLPALADRGVNLRSARADDAEYRILVETTRDHDVRSLVEDVEDACPTADLVAKRDRERASEADDPGTPELPAVADELTDRQREALEAAYRGGYFDWPRETTAEEVADRMGIAGSTFHNHLRKAEATLVEAFYEAGGRDDREE